MAPSASSLSDVLSVSDSMITQIRAKMQLHGNAINGPPGSQLTEALEEQKPGT